MDYKKKYEDALERARCYKGLRAEMETVFPELKEGEDGRIKTNIIKLLRFVRDTNHQYSDECNEAIAWLERQVEQKLSDLPKGEDYGIDSLYHAVRILEKTLGEVEGYQSDDGILEHKCAIEAVKRLYEQKPAWSEEDEKGFGDALWAIQQARTIAKDENDMGNLWYAENWLKSIKERMKGE